jgi:hypothetical protein
MNDINDSIESTLEVFIRHEPHCDNPMFGVTCTCWVREALRAREGESDEQTS